ncbi:hypothetical protein FHETE_7745 [Fusarium heterosporum]|uniref:Uncharacterized protein n=1 Tax=Fusarium heterosporum TaxID=42747 RepID=A0A8H5WK35_FUSHE|nr:hypothetical protein FHETE_7745 [Fusarium heterosporum]
MPAMAGQRPGLMQVSVSRSVEEKRLIPAHLTSLSRRAKELDIYRKHLYAEAEGVSFGIMTRISPLAVAVPHPLFSKLQQLHILLGRVFIDIVDRWFTDEKARFPERMPLDPSEEALLRWVVTSGCVPDYRHHGGIWRTDLLFGRSSDGLDDESPYVCEINGRFPLNAVIGISLGDNGLRELGASEGGLETANTVEEAYSRVMSMFDPEKPLFCIRDKWPGADSQVLSAIHAARGRQAIKTVRPLDLEARPDESSPTGFALWDRATNTHLEQWFVEMWQEEYAQLDETVIRQLALTPLNDPRTVFIVHDKRLLGIVPEELPGMISRGVLTPEEADLVASGIIQTINPGSEGIRDLLRESIKDDNVRKDYIYKPCRDGMGHGIELGRNLTQEAWLERLKKLANPDVLQPHDDAAVIQRLVDHKWFDVVRHEVPTDDGAKPKKFHLIGSMFMFHNQSFYPAAWRMGLETHLGITEENTGIVMAMVHPPDWPIGDDQEEEP